jgi:hypothetical protein
MAAQRHQVGSATERALVVATPVMPWPLSLDAADLHAEAELRAQPLRQSRQRT